MQEYKIEIPKRGRPAGFIPEHGLNYIFGNQIIELLKKKLVKLGYSDCSINESEMLIPANCYYSNIKEISWQDFLNLPERHKRGIPIMPSIRDVQNDINVFFESKDRNFQDFSDTLYHQVSKAFNIPIELLCTKFNKKETTMKKITIAQKVYNENNKIIGMKNEKSYYNMSQSNALIKYMAENKDIKSPDELLFSEKIENWSEHMTKINMKQAAEITRGRSLSDKISIWMNTPNPKGYFLIGLALFLIGFFIARFL